MRYLEEFLNNAPLVPSEAHHGDDLQIKERAKFILEHVEFMSDGTPHIRITQVGDDTNYMDFAVSVNEVMPL